MLGCDLEPDFNAYGFTQEEISKSNSITIRDALTYGVHLHMN